MRTRRRPGLGWLPMLVWMVVLTLLVGCSSDNSAEPATSAREARGEVVDVTEVTLAPTRPVDRQRLVQAGKVVAARLEGLELEESRVLVVGQELIVELAGDDADIAKALDVVAQRGQLLLRPVIETLPAPDTGPAETGPEVETGDPGAEVILPERDAGGTVSTRYRLGPAGLDGEAIASAEASVEAVSGTWQVEVTLTPQGADGFRALAERIGVGARIAIDFDGIVVSAPQLETTELAGELRITGNFTEREATDLAAVLQAGSLPVPLEPGPARAATRQLWGDRAAEGQSGKTGTAFSITTPDDLAPKAFSEFAPAIQERLARAGFSDIGISAGDNGLRIAVFGVGVHDEEAVETAGETILAGELDHLRPEDTMVSAIDVL